MQESFNLSQTLILAIAVFAFNLAVQSGLVLNPEKLKDIRLGWYLFGAGFLFVILGVIAITVLRWPVWNWIYVGIPLAISVGLTRVIQAEGLRKRTEDDKKKFAQKIAKIAWWLIRAAAVISIVLMIIAVCLSLIGVLKFS